MSVPPRASDGGRLPELVRFVGIMERLRRECPWDAEQTHRSLVHYLIEETGEVVDAVEAGSDTDLCEELGDLLLQVVFHAVIAAEQERFGIEDVARGVADKLIARHPYVFAGGEVPADLNATWEARKRLEKGRSSALDGIPESLSALARANKVVSRTRSHGVPVELAEQPISAADAGEQLLALVARAQASGVDPDQALRDALRGLERQVRDAERTPGGEEPQGGEAAGAQSGAWTG